MGILLIKITLLLYLLSTLGYTSALIVRRVTMAKAATWIFFGGFIVHSLSFVAQIVQTGHPAFAGLCDALSFFAWVLTGSYLAFQIKTKTRVLGAFVAPLTFLLMIVASTRLGVAVGIPPILKGGLVSLHILLSVAGEALFVLAACAGAMYLIQDRHIKQKKVNRLTRLFPSLRDLDRINHACLLWGFPLLTLGIVSGSIWAGIVWGSHWQWDSKQVWTFGAWCIFALLLHQRIAIGWKGHKAALLSVIFFTILLISYFAELLFFATVHRFF